MLDNLFIQNAFHPETQFYFFSVVITVTISIVLHELAHGWAAIRCGDQTPITHNRMTGNPLIHMGPYSIAALLCFGIAWGQMPIDPTRMRGKYAEAFVAVAGPATNLILALITLAAMTIMITVAPDTFNPPAGTDLTIPGQLADFLLIFGNINFLLCLFNLIPIPPLDGSAILANFYRPYARLLADPSKQQIFLFAFILVFIFAGQLFALALTVTEIYIDLITSLLQLLSL